MFSSSLFAEMRVLALSGSTREHSFNKQLLQEAVSLLKRPGLHVTNMALNGIPLYDADYEAQYGMPEKAKKLRHLMIQSDLIVIASPEYNGSMTGVLKNAIDWASRSETGSFSNEAFKGKHFLLMSASPGAGGGARGLRHLREVLTNLGGVVEPTEITVPNAQKALGNQNAPYYHKLQGTLDQLTSAGSL